MAKFDLSAMIGTFEDPKTLNPWDRNPRKNEAAIPKVMRSLREFGFGRPLVAWQSKGERRLLVGHTTLAAYLRLREEDPTWTPSGCPPGKVPVRWMDHLSERQAQGYALADNRLAEFSQWDQDLLSEVLQDLQAEGLDLSATGWNEAELDLLLSPPDPEALVEEMGYKAFDESIGEGAGQAREIKCPHCGETFKK